MIPKDIRESWITSCVILREVGKFTSYNLEEEIEAYKQRNAYFKEHLAQYSDLEVKTPMYEMIDELKDNILDIETARLNLIKVVDFLKKHGKELNE